MTESGSLHHRLRRAPPLVDPDAAGRRLGDIADALPEGLLDAPLRALLLSLIHI